MGNPFLGKWALVTGASSGLGADFARDLASRGASLILVARRVDRLNTLAEEVQKKYGVKTEVIASDLSQENAPLELYEKVKASGKEVDILVNNAGFGLYGNALDIPWEKEREMLQVDIITVVHLTRLFGRDMVARKNGYILQVSSVGAYQPSPTYATYSAAKSFVLFHGEALNHELRSHGVRVTVLSPGITRTEFLQVSGQTATLYQRVFMMESPTVVKIGLDALARGKTSIVSGLANRIVAWSNRLMPRRMGAMLSAQLMKNNH
jgi:uncharacterized protein